MRKYNYLKYKNTKFDKKLAKQTYKELCNFAKKRKDIIGYVEKHHIKPKSLGGSNFKRNIVILTYPEHLFAHYLLAIMYPKSKMTFAFHRMINIKSNVKNNSSKKAKLKTKSIENVNFSDFVLLEKLRLDFVNLPRKGNIRYNFSKEQIGILQNKAIKLLAKRQYTQLELVNKLNLPNVYILRSKIIDPLIKNGLLDKNIFNNKPDLVKLKSLVLNDLLDGLTVQEIAKKYSIGIDKLRSKIINPLIKEGKFSYKGTSKRYNKNQIQAIVKQTKSLLRKTRVNVVELCEYLNMSIESFNKLILPLIVNSKEYKRLLVYREMVYIIWYNGNKLPEMTKNELKEYFSNVEFVSFNGKSHRTITLLNNINRLSKTYDKICLSDTDINSVTPNKNFYNVKINRKMMKHVTRNDIAKELSKYNSKYLFLGDKKLLKSHFINSVCLYIVSKDKMGDCQLPSIRI